MVADYLLEIIVSSSVILHSGNYAPLAEIANQWAVTSEVIFLNWLPAQLFAGIVAICSFLLEEIF